MTFYGTTATRRRDRRAQEVPRRRSATTASGSSRSAPAPTSSSASKPGVEVVLEAFPGYWRHVPNVKRLVMKSVPDSTTRAGDAEDRRGRHRLRARRPRGRGDQARPAHAASSPRSHASIFWIEFTEQWDAKSPWHDKRLRLAVNLGARSQADQRGGLPRLLPAGGRHRAARHGLRAAGRAAALRPAEGQAAARRGRLSERASTPASSRAIPGFSDRGRGGGERPQRGRHPRQAAADGARDVLRRLAGEEAARAVHDRGRELRQRRQPRRGVHPVQGRLRLRRLSRHRRALPAAGARARPQASARRCSTRSSSSRSTG